MISFKAFLSIYINQQSSIEATKPPPTKKKNKVCSDLKLISHEHLKHLIQALKIKFTIVSNIPKQNSHAPFANCYSKVKRGVSFLPASGTCTATYLHNMEQLLTRDMLQQLRLFGIGHLSCQAVPCKGRSRTDPPGCSHPQFHCIPWCYHLRCHQHHQNHFQ